MYPFLGWLRSILLVYITAMPLCCGSKRQSLPCEDAALGSPFLWTLPSREPPVYFFGTIHVPYTLVWGHVSWLAKKSFERADSVFFELDLTDPETVAQLANCQMLPSGTTLSDILPQDLYKRLKRHLDYVKLMIPSWTQDEHRGLYSEYLFKAITGNWEKKRPVWIMLMMNSLTEGDIRSTGIPVLDLWLAREATRLGKRAGAVERVEEQCLPLNGLNESQVLFALNQTLVRLEELRDGRSSPFYSTEDLVRNYNCRNLSYASFGSSQMISENETEDLSQHIHRYFLQELVEKRNARMADRVLQLLHQYPDESFFFAFGAGHFLSNSSVLDYVRDGGYIVEQVSPDSKIRNFRRPHHHSRNRGVHQSILGPLHPWEEGSHRRRYRKRGHQQHHHGVQLLRSVTTHPTRSYHPRQFNDLWVKLDNSPESSTSDNLQDTLDIIKTNSKKRFYPWQKNNSYLNSGNFLINYYLMNLLTICITVWLYPCRFTYLNAR